MKKMTLTKVMQSNAAAAAKHSLHHTSQLQPQPQQHQFLNTPRRENEASDTADWQLFKELKTELSADRIYPHLTPLKQHVTINTPNNNELQQHVYPELPQLAAVEQKHAAVQQQRQEQHAGISKSEQWLDIRKPAIPAGHSGLVILISSIAFVVLLLGLIQVYRCDRPWRQRRELRPHQRPFTADEDSRDSFLSYNNQQQQPLPTPLKWHHSTRLLPPHRSPLHNLHVRELQKSSAVELPQTRCAKSQHNRLTMTSNNHLASSSASSSNSSSSCSSHSSSHYNPSNGTNVTEDDAFYIEMTPDSGQIASSVHSDLLPMELLNVASNKRSTNSRVVATETMQSLEWKAGQKAATHLTQSDGEIIGNEEPAKVPLNQNASVASSLEHRLPLNKLAPATTRKFGLW